VNGGPILEAVRVTKRFPRPRWQGGGWVAACDDVSLALGAAEAEIVSVVGESGSGKTTLARLLLRLERPDGGHVAYRGRDVARLRGPELLRFRREVQAVFQDPYAIFNPFYRVDRALYLPLRRFGLTRDAGEARAMVRQALEAVDLRPDDVLGRYPHQLSGGERQRIMLARLALLRPRVIVADEPVSMIDAALRTMFLNVLLDLRDQGVSCLFITHNLQTAYYLGGRGLVLYRGRVVETGTLDAILTRPAHPYTQMLLEAVPADDPERRWTEPLPAHLVASGLAEAAGPACPFADRCPHVRARCRAERPELVAVEPGHEAACFLYQDGGSGVPEGAGRAAEPL
jgi:oligopeptide/dipeptide ABC transporter ATP-binding protein